MYYSSLSFVCIALLHAPSIYALPASSSSSPSVSKCQIVEASSVGIELSTDYATSAIHYANGSTIAIATVQATEEYSGLMRQRASSSFQPLRIQGSAPYWPGQQQQQQPEASAVPKQSKVLATSNMLAAIKLQSETVLGCPLPAVLIVYPDLPGLTPHEISAAARDSGLSAIDVLVTPTAAALVPGSDLLRDCAAPPCRHTRRVALSIAWTRSRLLISASEYRDSPASQPADAPTRYAEASHSAWDLGSRSADLAASPAERDAFYARMYEEIRSWAGKLLPRVGAVTQIVLGGEGAHEPAFVEVVENVLGDVLVDDVRADGDVAADDDDWAPSLTLDRARDEIRRQAKSLNDADEKQEPEEEEEGAGGAVYAAAKGAAIICAREARRESPGRMWRRAVGWLSGA